MGSTGDSWRGPSPTGADGSPSVAPDVALPSALARKLVAARARVAALDGVVVGLSGGVDSSLLARLCVEQHRDRALAVIARSPSLAARELEAAVDVAGRLGIRHRVVDTDEVADRRYAANPRNRCFYCRDELFGRLTAIAREEGLGAVAYGENADDDGDHRPGRAAALAYGVHAPLRDAGLGKADVRGLARAFGLPVWDKPALACLASRIPYGSEVTEAKLRQVEAAEEVLWRLGCAQVRVRHHGDVARIEVAREDLPRVLDRAEEVVAGVRAAGFAHVTVDLDGYRRGSLNGATARHLPVLGAAP